MNVDQNPTAVIAKHHFAVHSRSGEELTNFIGGFGTSEYRSSKEGGPPKWMSQGRFQMRPDGVHVVELAGEVPTEEIPDLDVWGPRILGPAATWNKNAMSEVRSLLTQNTANSTAFPTRTTEHWQDETGVYRLNKQLASFGCEIASETIASNGETFFNVRVTEHGVTKYVQIAWEAFQMGHWSSAVSQNARITDGIGLFMVLHGDWQSRTPDERRELKRVQLKAEKAVSDAAFDRRLASI